MENSGQAFFQFRFGERYHHRFRKESQISVDQRRKFMAARALDFLVCVAINERHLPADGSIPNHSLCVRCDQKALATRKHELWECPGNTLISHMRMKESEYPTSLAFWDTDQVLFAHGLLPRDCLLASEFAECNEACAKNHVLFASDGSGGSREIPKH